MGRHTLGEGISPVRIKQSRLQRQIHRYTDHDLRLRVFLLHYLVHDVFTPQLQYSPESIFLFGELSAVFLSLVPARRVSRELFYPSMSRNLYLAEKRNNQNGGESTVCHSSNCQLKFYHAAGSTVLGMVLGGLWWSRSHWSSVRQNSLETFPNIQRGNPIPKTWRIQGTITTTNILYSYCFLSSRWVISWSF